MCADQCTVPKCFLELISAGTVNKPLKHHLHFTADVSSMSIKSIFNLNLHTDNSTDKKGTHFPNLLENIKFIHTSKPTDSCYHILDILITQGLTADILYSFCV